MFRKTLFTLTAVVALGTVRYGRHRELLRVDVLMAVFTRSWRHLEIDINQLSFQIRRLVTVLAGGRTVRSQ